MIAWLNPAALAGLALVAGPVLVHLLLRHRAARVPFPSLRFVRPSRTAAVRLRRPSDPALLLLRMAIVAVAIAASAQPLLLAPSRLRAWNARMARVIVVDVGDTPSTRLNDRSLRAGPSTRPNDRSLRAGPSTRPNDRSLRAGPSTRPNDRSLRAGLRNSETALSEAGEVVTAETQGTVFAVRIDAPALGSGVLQAVQALAGAPPARREIVVVSDFRRGALTTQDLDLVPAGIGIRLVQVGAQTENRTVRGMELYRPGAATSTAPSHDIILSSGATAVSVVAAAPSSADGLRLLTADGDDGALPALERAVAAAGAPAPSSTQPILAVFAGGPGVEAVRQHSEIWMVETVRRMGNDRGLGEACSDALTRATNSPEPDPRVDSADTRWHVLCLDAQSRPIVRTAAAGSHLVVHVAAHPSALLSAAVVRAALIARHGSVARPEAEIQRMTAAELAGWSRQPAPVAADSWRSGEQSDRRWCWALALALLAGESVVRRRKTGGGKTWRWRSRPGTPREARADAA